MRKTVKKNDLGRNVVVDVHDDMLKDKFWKEHAKLLLLKSSKLNLEYNGEVTDIVSEQIGCLEDQC